MKANEHNFPMSSYQRLVNLVTAEYLRGGCIKGLIEEKLSDIQSPIVLEELALSKGFYSTILQNETSVIPIADVTHQISQVARDLLIGNFVYVTPLNPNKIPHETDTTVSSLIRDSWIVDLSDASVQYLVRSLNFFRLPFRECRSTIEQSVIRRLKNGTLEGHILTDIATTRSFIRDLIANESIPDCKVARYTYLIGMLEQVSIVVKSRFTALSGSLASPDSDALVKFARWLASDIRRTIAPVRRELWRAVVDAAIFNPESPVVAGVYGEIQSIRTSKKEKVYA